MVRAKEPTLFLFTFYFINCIDFRTVYTQDLTDPCNPNPCIHGDCLPNCFGQEFFCYCHNLYSGVLCENMVTTERWMIAPCMTKSCMNGGTCYLTEDYSLPERFADVCICPTGFTGDYCESTVTACDNNTCQNGGACLADSPAESCLGYTCLCQMATTVSPSATTQPVDDVCQSASCLSCTLSDGLSGSNCQCWTGFDIRIIAGCAAAGGGLLVIVLGVITWCVLKKKRTQYDNKKGKEDHVWAISGTQNDYHKPAENNRIE